MEKDPNHILWKKTSGNALAPEETSAFEHWIQQPENQSEYEENMRIHSAIRGAMIRDNISPEESWKKLSAKRLSGRILKMLRYAAMIILPLSVGLGYFLWNNHRPAAITAIPDPHKKGIVITLSSGEELLLGDFSANIEDGGHLLSASRETGLIYTHTENFSDSIVRYNEIYVPRGAEYQVKLADSSIIWLNADSYMRYPVTVNSGERIIELKGEAYFQVKKGSSSFIVKTGGYDVRVTGTEFNVRNYPEKPIQTTLVRGSVLIEHGKEIIPLKPGQQAALSGTDLKVTTVNVGRLIAWKEGQFIFNNIPLENMLEELARWYDLEVIFRDEKLKTIPFSAWFDRQYTVQEMIRILEATEKIKFDLSGNILTVKN